MKPSPAFRIRIPPGRQYVTVYLHPTFRSLRDAIKPDTGRTASSEALAAYRENLVVGTPRGRVLTEAIGELHFCEKRLGSGIVAHEMFHVVVHWCRIKRWDPRQEPRDENLAQLTEGLNARFWRGWFTLHPEVKPIP